MANSTVLLFYKYVAIPQENVESVATWLRAECEKLNLVGRVLLATEGINANLAGTAQHIEEFTKLVSTHDYFKDIDFKFDVVQGHELFPDLKVKVQKEICATAHTMSLDLIQKGLGGKHLKPAEFHAVLEEYWGGDKKNVPNADVKKELVVIDVRNRKEYNLGRFQSSHDEKLRAVDPDTKMFSEWSTSYADKHAQELKNKKVLMYCTGGIRCEKASAYLRSLGVDDVSQLSGGIHRYLEEYKTDGYFQGKNFVFDSRGLQDPTFIGGKHLTNGKSNAVVLGKCFDCGKPEEGLSADRACAVCRDAVLVCDGCRVSRRGVYYCKDHTMYDGFYYPFLASAASLDTKEELERQRNGLQALIDGELSGPTHRGRRKAAHKQLNRVVDHLAKYKQDEQATTLASGQYTQYRICPHNKLVKSVVSKPGLVGDNLRNRTSVVPKCRSCGDFGPRELLDLIASRQGDDQSTTGQCICENGDSEDVDVCTSKCWGFFGYGKGYANVHGESTANPSRDGSTASHEQNETQSKAESRSACVLDSSSAANNCNTQEDSISKDGSQSCSAKSTISTDERQGAANKDNLSKDDSQVTDNKDNVNKGGSQVTDNKDNLSNNDKQSSDKKDNLSNNDKQSTDNKDNCNKETEQSNLPADNGKKKRKDTRNDEPGAKKKRKKRGKETKMYDETEYWIDRTGPIALRRVVPYLHTFTTFAKQRWYKRTILDVFSDEFGSNTAEYYTKALNNGLMRVNDKVVGPDYVLNNSDFVQHLIHRHEPAVAFVPVPNMVVEEHEDYLLINKPATLPVHPTGAFCYNSLTVLLAREWPSCKPGETTLHPVHRLDRLTSGLIIIAKSSAASVRLAAAMNHKGSTDSGAQVSSKGYIAKVSGRFPASKAEYESKQDRCVRLQQVLQKHPRSLGTQYIDPEKYIHENQITDIINPGVYWKSKEVVDLSKIPSSFLTVAGTESVELSCPIRCASRKVGAWECSLDGDSPENKRFAEKPSLSRFILLSYDEATDTSIVHCEPLTGRTHQLRLHLQLLGFPISNDPNYHELPAFYTDNVSGIAEAEEDAEMDETPGDVVTLPEGLIKQPTNDAERTVLETCDYCSNGEHICFSKNQLRHTGIHLHAYRYKATDEYDWSVPFPEWATPPKLEQ